jgi:hypothetical protein
MVIAPRAREASVQISLQFDRSRTVDSAAQDVQAARSMRPCYDHDPVLNKGRAISW